jgi:hypothetical protein
MAALLAASPESAPVKPAPDQIFPFWNCGLRKFHKVSHINVLPFDQTDICLAFRRLISMQSSPKTLKQSIEPTL